MLGASEITNETKNEDRIIDLEILRVVMTFNILEVKDFYKQYANGKCFIKYCTGACSCAGKPMGSRSSRPVSKQTVRTVCKTRINIRACQDGKFYLSGCMSEHSHELSPGSLRNNRRSTSMGPHHEIHNHIRYLFLAQLPKYLFCILHCGFRVWGTFEYLATWVHCRRLDQSMLALRLDSVGPQNTFAQVQWFQWICLMDIFLIACALFSLSNYQTILLVFFIVVFGWGAYLSTWSLGITVKD